mgnify:CR=1 FL=1
MTSLYIAKSFRSGYNEFAIKEVLIMNIKNALKGLALSIISLAVGFAALAIPFKLYMAFSGGTLWAFFAFEIAAYTLLACAKDKKQKRKNANSVFTKESKKSVR